MDKMMRMEEAARPLPRGATSEVIGYWLQRTVDAFKPASLGHHPMRELGQRLEERIRAWKTYETKLNEAVAHMEEVFSHLQGDEAGHKKMDLEVIEEMLQDAEAAAAALGTPTQLSSVAISRRQFEELKAATEEKAREVALLEEVVRKRVQKVLTSISNWNGRAQDLLTVPEQMPRKLTEKIIAIRELLAETDPVSWE
ncbi:unnamed protein product [Hydatigera taeniaeformis]|uniref:Uncharacterized protein n=1 Tax=Hydatigena taeniaeformis TaxID=6205 RepID=A0A3P7EPD9_HYDTA|nr:unnamed protein product [Hydatigera taeniaeformis]